MQRVDVPRLGIAFAAAILLVTLTAGSAVAQEDAGIIGVVTDESGAVLPGVTITITGPSLQVPSMTAVSDARGEFRITPLPIGTYVVEYTLTGFQGVKREAVRLTVGFTAKVDAQLKIGSVEETITVSAASPVVDVKSTTTTTQLTRETIELLPSSRNGIVSILGQAPGVRTLRDVGGSTLNQVPTITRSGRRVSRSRRSTGVDGSLQSRRTGELLGLHGDREAVNARERIRSAQPRHQPERGRQVGLEPVPAVLNLLGQSLQA
jgi:hypothetical protein